MSVGISNNTQNISFSGLQAKGLAQKGKRMMKYIEFTHGSPVSDTFVKEMSDGIHSIDERVLKQIIRVQNLKVKLAEKCSDAFPELKGLHPRGWPEGETWDNVCNISMNGRIGLFEHPIDHNQPPSTAKIRHEFGHELHRAFQKVIGVDFINTAGYTQAYLKDITNLPKSIEDLKIKEIPEILRKSFSTPDGLNTYKDWLKEAIQYQVQGSTPDKATEAGKQETFAEVFALLTGKYENLFKPYEVLFPNTITYVEKLLYLMGKR